jgi:hypothetical protein
MTTKTKQLKLSLARDYPALVKRVCREIEDLEFLVKRRTAETYWRVGEFIHEHILENKQRAGYGNFVLKRLAEDVDRDFTTLSRSLQFYRTYPKLASQQLLSWSQYKQLITIKDEGQRKQLEQQFISKEFDTRKSQSFLNFKKLQLTAKDDPDKPVTQLAFTRGNLWTYGVVESPEQEGGFLLDLV